MAVDKNDFRRALARFAAESACYGSTTGWCSVRITMNVLKSIVIHFSMWISGSPRMQLPCGQQLPDSWLNDCVSDNRRPIELAAQAARAIQPLMPDLRQCEPWRGTALGTGSIGMDTGRSAQPQHLDVEPRTRQAAAPVPATIYIPTRVRSIAPRATKSGV